MGGGARRGGGDDNFQEAAFNLPVGKPSRVLYVSLFPIHPIYMQHRFRCMFSFPRNERVAMTTRFLGPIFPGSSQVLLVQEQ